MTRKDYMEGRVTHAEYYESLAAAAGVDWRAHPALARIQAALTSGDEHLNTIPLSWWDMQAGAILNPRAAFKAHGDAVSQAGLVCLCKAAAKKAALAPGAGG